MKTLLFALIIALTILVVGCKTQNANGTFTPNSIPPVVVIEGCEYFECATYGIGAYVYTHKGNCKNPIHCYNSTVLIPKTMVK